MLVGPRRSLARYRSTRSSNRTAFTRMLQSRRDSNGKEHSTTAFDRDTHARLYMLTGIACAILMMCLWPNRARAWKYLHLCAKTADVDDCRRHFPWLDAVASVGTCTRHHREVADTGVGRRRWPASSASHRVAAAKRDLHRRHSRLACARVSMDPSCDQDR